MAFNEALNSDRDIALNAIASNLSFMSVVDLCYVFICVSDRPLKTFYKCSAERLLENVVWLLFMECYCSWRWEGWCKVACMRPPLLLHINLVFIKCNGGNFVTINEPSCYVTSPMAVVLSFVAISFVRSSSYFSSISPSSSSSSST